jgi:hypothetical protein
MELRTLGLRTISLAFLAPDFVKAAVDGGIDNGLNSIPTPPTDASHVEHCGRRKAK